MSMSFTCAIRGVVGQVLLLVLTRFVPTAEGVEFLLSDDFIQTRDGPILRTTILSGESISTDGSGLLLITDISLTNGQTQTSDDSALFCHATKDVNMVRDIDILGDWYLQFDFDTTTTIGERIDGNNDRGWTRDRGTVNVSGIYYLHVRLKRVSETAVEGKFSCQFPGDSNNNKYLLILSPILSVKAVIEVATEDQFRVHCTSTGGRVLNMSITGPHGVVYPLSNIQPVGTQRWMGNDSYSASATLQGADDGDIYDCSASNGVSSVTDRIEIGVVSKPVIGSLERVSPTEVIVEWSQPLGGATVTGYVVFYYDGSVTRNKRVPWPPTSTEVTVSSATAIHVISVMALSEEPFLPRRAAWETVTLWSPEGAVEVDGSETTSVRVSWEAVEADYYTVLFSAVLGDDQEGLCRDEPLSASVTVNGSTTDLLNVSIAVEEDVGSNETSSVRIYTTYYVAVVAFSDVWGRTVGSEPITFTTPQRGAAVAPSNVSATAISSTAISVEWDDLALCALVNGLIVRYRVQYRTNTGAEQKIEQTGTWNSSSSVAILGLTPSTNYFIKVAAVNEEGHVGLYSDTISVQTKPLCSDYSWQCIALAVPLGALLVVTVLTTFLLSVFCCNTKCKKRSQKYSPEDSAVIPLDNVSEQGVEYGGEPRILKFPVGTIRVVEGERVQFDVKVTGDPQPKLTWYHEGEEVVTNYSIDVGLDGGLSIPCTEPIHTGLYQLVAVNSAGRAERQVQLFVRREEQPQQTMTQQNTDNSVTLTPVTVVDFEEYIASGHANENSLFQEQFNIYRS